MGREMGREMGRKMGREMGREMGSSSREMASSREIGSEVEAAAVGPRCRHANATGARRGCSSQVESSYRGLVAEGL